MQQMSVPTLIRSRAARSVSTDQLLANYTRSIIQKSTIEWRVDDLSDGHLAVFT